MRQPLPALSATLCFLATAAPAPADDAGPKPEEVRAAVAKSLPPLQKGATEYIKHRECFSCHNQALPVFALSAARGRGFAVSDEARQQALRFTADSLARGKDNYLKGRGQGGQADTAGYALFGLSAGGWRPDETTAAVAEYLLQRDADRDHWQNVSRRPPSENSPFTTTYLALRGLRAFAAEEQKERVAARVEKARRWLQATPAKDTEDRVFRLWGLKAADAEDKEVRVALRELLDTQRKDGGWGQTEEMDSDAYATGSALTVAHLAGGLGVNDPVYRRGLAFLVRSQLEDGTWHVRSRSKPFQLYFESGFPHGNDQFISAAASSWAAAALALACPEEPRKKEAP